MKIRGIQNIRYIFKTTLLGTFPYGKETLFLKTVKCISKCKIYKLPKISPEEIPKLANSNKLEGNLKFRID